MSTLRERVEGVFRHASDCGVGTFMCTCGAQAKAEAVLLFLAEDRRAMVRALRGFLKELGDNKYSVYEHLCERARAALAAAGEVEK